MTGRRYPLQPLLTETGLTRRQARAELGINHTRWTELERDGLTDEAADRYAIRLGVFPWNVWPSWLTDATGWDHDHPSLHDRAVPPTPSSSDTA